MQSRRTMLARATGLAFAGLARQATAANTTHAEIQADPYRSEVEGYGRLVADPRGIFDLPAGFSYTVVSQAGELMSDGLVTPQNMDGMGCFPLSRGRVALVRNHELRINELDSGAFGVGQRLLGKVDRSRIYDFAQKGEALVGGTSTLVYDLRKKRLESSHLSLVGTSTNCAGGRTPWGSWLSCEEITNLTGPKADGSGVGKSHGWVFEVPSAARGLVEPVPLQGMGRFRHEAAAVDPRTGVVYLTEDEGDGLFYRYLPNDRRVLAKGGRLQALGVQGGDAPGDSRNWNRADWPVRQARKAVWIDVEGIDNSDGTLKARGAAKGATKFARGEGLYFGEGELYFTCTSGGPGKLGQVMRYRPSPKEGQAGERDQPGQVEIFVQPTDRTVMMMPDNIAVAPWGHLVVCEDRAEKGGVNYLKGITPEGRIYTIGRQAQTGATDVGANAELAGVCFSPDGATLFVNIYAPGTTLAVTGPWARLKG